MSVKKLICAFSGRVAIKRPVRTRHQRVLKSGEDAAEVVADGGEHHVGGTAGAALEVAAAEMSFSLQVSDEGLDGGAAAPLALDNTEDTALLAGNG